MSAVETARPIDAGKEVIAWHQHPKLAGTRLGALIEELKEFETQIADLEERRSAVRSLISPLVTGISEAICSMDRRIDWFPEKTAVKGEIDEKLLVSKLGLTPDQLSLARKEPKKTSAYFKVSKYAPTSSDALELSSPAESPEKTS